MSKRKEKDLAPLHKFGMVFVTGPLGQIIVDIDNPRAIEDMARGFEWRWHCGCTPEIEKGGKRQPHIATFVGNQGAAQLAADFAGQNARVLVEFTVVKVQVFDAFGNSDVLFVKDGGPLHRSPMQFLTGLTMTNFGIHRIRAHLVLDRIAKAAGAVFG